MDYPVNTEPSVEHAALLRGHQVDMSLQCGADTTAESLRAMYTESAAEEVWKRIAAHSGVSESIVSFDDSIPESAPGTIVVARHPDERQVKGVKSGLKSGKQKMPYLEFHKKHAHIGNCSDSCKVCHMIKGAMRRITKKVSPYRENRPGHTWSMDMITFSHRSMNGNKYLIQLRDHMSGVIIGIPCYLKSDAPIHIENWITQMRADPAFYNLPFKIVSTIITDGAGEWSRNSRKWKAALMRIKMTEVIYVTPETSKEAGLSERANCILEEAIKAIMMEQNLPEDHWEVCSSNAMFLLNRFPNLAGDSTAPIDGDQALPLEILTRGHYSRRQLYRELSYFVQIGTPALVHAAKIKGSTLAPKVRWGVAWGMYTEQVVWRCPFTHSTFRSKSFTAFELRDNLNYAQFLGLPEMETTRKGVAIQGDINEDISIWLQPAMPASAAHQQPVVSIQSANEQAVQYIKLPAPQEAQDPPDGPLDKGGEATEINTETCPELGGSDHDVTTLGNTQDQVYNTGQQLNTGPQEGITAQQ